MINFIAEDKSRIKCRLKASQTFFDSLIFYSRSQCLFYSGYFSVTYINIMKDNTFVLEMKVLPLFFSSIDDQMKKYFLHNVKSRFLVQR